MAGSRSFNQRTFEEYDPNDEWSRDAEAETVRISLPGFKREEIRVLVDNHGHLRTRGERRPVAGTANKWSRFQKDFQLPDNCNVDGIRAKFENETLTITLPKKTPSPPSGPVTPPTPVPEPPRKPSAAPSQRLPPALPEPAARPAAPPTVPAATLSPPASQKAPAERKPSMTRKPAPEEKQPKGSYGGGGGASAATKPPDQEEEEERKRMKVAGKTAEDTMKAKEEQAPDEAVAAEMALAQQPRPVSATRGLLMNAAVAAVLLLGITVYVWHTLRNATGGAGGHGHGHLGAGSYGDEM